MIDPLHAFFEKLERGELPQAIAQLLPSPQACYESLSSAAPAFPYLVNFVDAALFENGLAALIANRCLLSFLKQAPEIQERYPQALSHLERDAYLLEFAEKREGEGPELSDSLSFFRLLLAERNRELLSEQQKNELLRDLQPLSIEFFKKKLALSQGWIAFQKMKPAYAALCGEGAPWYPLRYLGTPSAFAESPKKVPLLFLEPLECSFAFLNQLKNRPALFVFETRAHLQQLLQFPEVLEALGDERHLLYILDLYPNTQLALQSKKSALQGPFEPFLLCEKKQLKPIVPLLAEALGACLNQPEESLGSDTESGNWLYQLAKRHLLTMRQERLGISRAPALLETMSMEKWSDPHKALPPPEKPLGLLPQDRMAMRLAQLELEAFPRPRKLRLVHIVPQVVDGGHAPSRLLENLIVHHARNRFELYLISSERLQFHPFDYPYNFYVSPSSEERAPKRLALFKSSGINVQVIHNQSYEKSARWIAEFLRQIHADIAVFHGPDVINCMAARLSDVPLRVLFEHGTPPAYPGFDLALVSSQGAVEIYRELFAKIGTRAHALPFHLDVRGQWEAAPYPKEKLGLPQDSLAMTTISNHLESRLGHEMCAAIAEILAAVPNAYYVPMGRISEEAKQKFGQFFSGYGVAGRVKFLGSVAQPSQWARSMHLYLNEFPFGSCLGILDAMASGVPVVTMYDLEGPPQARYGGEYMGVERAVSSCRREEYVALACRLLKEPSLYEAWAEHTKQQYEKHADVPAYVNSFEQILIKEIERI
jgi:glycosyltransferase involved in cell wall biosynthesis